jgi:hypothetical protein
MRVGVLALLALLAACGRAGDPLPPFIRIPERVNDLAVSQRGYEIILTWTNPARNIDGSASTDLELIQIISGGRQIATFETTAAGQAQSWSVSARSIVGSPQTFAVVAETVDGKLSEISNTVSITPLDVPGRVPAVRHVVDENRIRLEWDPPLENVALADVYIVDKVGGNAENSPVIVTERSFEDNRYETGQQYAYTITPARRSEQGLAPGVTSEIHEVVAIDRTAPQAPRGLEIIPSGAFLTWLENPEMDLAGYRVFRSSSPDSGFSPLTENIHAITGIFDANYRSGLYYVVTAVDESGNESVRSAPVRAP